MNTKEMTEQKSIETTPLIADTYVATDTFRSKVIKDVLRPFYYENIKEIVESSRGWRRVSATTFNLALVFNVFGIILTTVSGMVRNNYIVIAAVACSSISMGLHCYSTSATAQSRGETKALNNILGNLNIVSVPDISTQPHDEKV